VRSTDASARVGLGVIAVLSVACTTVVPPEGQSEPATAAGTGSPEATPSSTPSRASPSEPAVVGIKVPALGHPFTAASLLAAMRDSRRPGGVPDQIETDAIAAEVAGAIWTYGAQPWTTQSVGGSCGPATCTLEIAGAGPNAQGDDVWVFAVTPDTSEVMLITAELGSVPVEILAPLDDLARALDEEGVLGSMLLASASWLPPPDEGQFVLSYRSGGEEGACAIDLTLDAVDPDVTSTSSTGC
jgi:hypothetical protein